MQRAVIIAKGDVQRVGYRDAVEKIARKLNIVGYVENLKPYDVRVVAEGEKYIIERFINEIQIKKPPTLVEKIDFQYKKPTGKFKYFEIKRGDWKEELGERLDTAGNFLYKSLDKQDQLGEKIDKGFNRMDQNFTTLRDDYGKISKTMEKILDCLVRQQKDSTEATNRLTSAILKLAEKR